MFELKTYQESVLESLSTYLKACHTLQDASFAYYKVTEQLWEQGLSYRAIKDPSELADIPYVCLRVPTGGGKTLLACHAVAIANKEYLNLEYSLVLWLVPSNAIRVQTLLALQNRNHPYRQALENTLGRVSVMDVGEALYINKSILDSETVIIVATLQAFRVEEKEGRKVYESAGALHHHFSEIEKVKDILYTDENGVIPFSLENVMRLRRPLVIVDEAHNARTELSFGTLARFRPSAIIEFTATPDNTNNPSNVLHSVSAAELKAEDMIKLPIRLETKTDWQAILSDAIAQRAELEKHAEIEQRTTGDYIRPIMLIQAQPHRQDKQTLTVEVLEKSLVDDHHIPAEQIVRATGDDRGLDGVDLKDPQCPIRFVITVQALREGWDCPFAYVLCSVAEQRSSGAVEQILGRVLRMPYSKSRSEKELNQAYTFVTSPNFFIAAKMLEDALVDSGFQKQEVKDLIKPIDATQPAFIFGYTKAALPKKTITLPTTPSTGQLAPELGKKIEIDEAANTITIKEPLHEDEKAAVAELLAAPEAEAAWVQAVNEYNQEVAELVKTPSEKKISFKVPALCIKRSGQLELFEEDHLLDYGWNLNAYDPKLTNAEFTRLTDEGGAIGVVDVSAEGKIKTQFIPELYRQLQAMVSVTNWNDAQLIHWLDYYLRFQELTSEEKSVFLTAMVGDLLDNRGMPLSQINRKKFNLLEIAQQKIIAYRKDARKQAYEQLLFKDHAAEVAVTPEKCFSFDPENYPRRKKCSASDMFTKHFYPDVGDLEDKGEEFMCAQFIDSMDEVDFWVRNLDRQPQFSFWLQTSTDKFYPDFICKLKNGKFLVVEYKGADRWSNDDSKEKRRLGDLWAMKSGGSCLFVMPKGHDLGAIKQAVLVN
ncbi:MAG: DEAD/DEAH box helicase family protein [Deltaproteobacteria bacterium]|nr:DEAD/DEAH box helicase family protein [Deltaproteobacteria bacterium]